MNRPLDVARAVVISLIGGAILWTIIALLIWAAFCRTLP